MSDARTEYLTDRNRARVTAWAQERALPPFFDVIPSPDGMLVFALRQRATADGKIVEEVVAARFFRQMDATDAKADD